MSEIRPLNSYSGKEIYPEDSPELKEILEKYRDESDEKSLNLKEKETIEESVKIKDNVPEKVNQKYDKEVKKSNLIGEKGLRLERTEEAAKVNEILAKYKTKSSKDKNEKTSNEKIETNEKSVKEKVEKNEKGAKEKAKKNKIAVKEKVETHEKAVKEKVETHEKVVKEKVETNQKAVKEKVEKNQKAVNEKADKEKVETNENDVNETIAQYKTNSDTKSSKDKNEKPSNEKIDVKEKVETNKIDMKEKVETHEKDVKEKVETNEKAVKEKVETNQKAFNVKIETNEKPGNEKENAQKSKEKSGKEDYKKITSGKETKNPRHSTENSSQHEDSHSLSLVSESGSQSSLPRGATPKKTKKEKVVLKDHTMDFSDKHRQRMKLNVFDRLSKK